METARLILRPWKESDAEEAFANWMNDPEVTKFLTWTPHGDISVTRELLQIWEKEYASPAVYHWAIVLKEGNVLIGDICVVRVDAYQERGELGYCMGKAWWGKGIMTETLSEVLRYCFEEVGFYRIDGTHAAKNIGSSRVMEKCGLQYEGTRRRYIRLLSTGERVDIVQRGILREEYFANRATSEKKTREGEQKGVTLYTDGACSGNPGAGGWGCILLYGEHELPLSGGEKETTNNRMEIMAVIAGLERLKFPCAVTVYSDSAYTVNAFNEGWVYAWERSGWKKADNKPVQNDDLWKRLLSLTRKHQVTFCKVKGHADDALNNRCDALARAAIPKTEPPAGEGGAEICLDTNNSPKDDV